MTSALPPAELLEGVVRVLEPAFRLDRLVHATAERVVYHAWDRLLKRHVALHTHLAPDAPGPPGFRGRRETSAPSAPPTSPTFSPGRVAGALAYRRTNRGEGESLA